MCDLCLPSRRWVLKGIVALPLVGVLPSPAVGMSAGSGIRRPGPGRAVSLVPGLDIHPRFDWAGDDRPPTAVIPVEDVRFLLVHHTAGGNDYSREAVPQLIRNIYDFHTGPEKGWPDVAYNFLIDRYGGVWEARAGAIDGAVRGDATGGNQGFSQLVSLMGEFSGQLPTSAALGSLTATLAWLADRHGLDTQPGATASFESQGSNRHPEGTSVATPTVTGHRTMSQTSCPGDALFSYVEGSLMTDITALRSPDAGPSPEPSTTIPPPTIPPPTIPPPTTAPPPTVSAAPRGPVSSFESSADTVDVVPAPSSELESATPLATERADSESGAGGLSFVQGSGLAGAGLAAAVGGLLLMRSRSSAQPDPEAADGPEDRPGQDRKSAP